MDIQEALDQLNKDERKIIDLLFFEGKTVRECADELGAPTMTIQCRKKKILKKLEKFLWFFVQTGVVNG